jgi:protein gp37
MDLDWVRDLQEQYARAGVAFFLKQLGGVRNKRGGDAAAIDGQCWRQMPDAAV